MERATGAVRRLPPATSAHSAHMEYPWPSPWLSPPRGAPPPDHRRLPAYRPAISSVIPRSNTASLPPPRSPAIPRSNTAALPPSRSSAIPRSNTADLPPPRSSAVPRSNTAALPPPRSSAIPRSNTADLPPPRSSAIPRSNTAALPPPLPPPSPHHSLPPLLRLVSTDSRGLSDVSGAGQLEPTLNPILCRYFTNIGDLSHEAIAKAWLAQNEWRPLFPCQILGKFWCIIGDLQHSMLSVLARCNALNMLIFHHNPRWVSAQPCMWLIGIDVPVTAILMAV